jgi:hypothetical protein
MHQIANRKSKIKKFILRRGPFAGQFPQLSGSLLPNLLCSDPAFSFWLFPQSLPWKSFPLFRAWDCLIPSASQPPSLKDPPLAVS